MYRILSISLGSPTRDKSLKINLKGETFFIERKGTGGDIPLARSLFSFYNGKIDAFGLGGANFYYVLGDNKYKIKEAFFVTQDVNLTPVTDGSNIKRFFEKRIPLLVEDVVEGWKGKTVFFASVLDRYFLAEALEEKGAKLIIGDAVLALGLNFPFYSLKRFIPFAKLFLPFLRHLPLRLLYPLQEIEPITRKSFEEYYRKADILAGDFLLLKRYLPLNLKGKTILTSTITAKDRELLRQRGVKLLITVSPNFEGRSFGDNVLEAMLLAYNAQKKGSAFLTALTENNIREFFSFIDYKPNIEKFSS